jgi:ketosteroid isomerase-like protein
MSDEERNVALLKQAYKSWSDTLGASGDAWMKICSEQIQFGSLAQAPAGAQYFTEYGSRDALKEYFAGLERDWQMIEYAVEHFVAQGDRVVMLGRCGWRYKKTGKVVWTKKVDSWRFADGKAVEYFEYYDTAQVLAAMV